MASDGLQFLSNGQISQIVLKNLEKDSTAIAEALLDELRELDDPEQDNVCFSVIKVENPTANGTGDNIFVPEYNKHEERPARVRTRPIKPQDIPETPALPERVVSRQNGSNGSHSAAEREDNATAPIFLRRRWLAGDGGA